MINIKITGADKVIHQLEELAKKSGKAVRDASIKGGFRIEADAKKNVAVDTGRLRASLTTNWTGSGMSRATIIDPSRETKGNDAVGQPSGGKTGFTVIVGTNVEYAPYIEYGTSKKGARPYLFPAFNKNQTRITKDIGEAVGELF